MFSIGPGRYSETTAMMSSKRSGRSFFSMSRTPAPSTWNTPTVSPRDKRSKVGRSSSGSVVEIERDAAPSQQFEAARQHGQRLEAEKVEFDETGQLDPFHVELGHRHVGARVAVERHQLGQRPVADHDPGGVRRGVPVQAFEAQRDFDQPRHRLVGVALLLQLRLAGDRLFEADRVRRVVRHQLAQPVDLAVRHARARGRHRAARRAPATCRT